MMVRLLRSARLLALAFWVGGISFFVIGVAPVAFSHAILDATGSTKVSGMMVGESLERLHWIGIVCGVVLLVSGVGVYVVCKCGQGLMIAEALVTLAMMFGTAYSMMHIIPLMNHDRALVGGDFSRVAADSPEKLDFDKLHHRSTQVEGGVLLLGLLLVVLTAGEPLERRREEWLER